MTSKLLTVLATPSRCDTDVAIENVTRYFVRCGIRDTGFLHQQSCRIVEKHSSQLQSSQFLGRCLRDAVEFMRGLPDRGVDKIQRSDQDCTPTKQFAFSGTDDLLFTAESFANAESVELPQRNGQGRKPTMVIPPVEPTQFKSNSTPALIGPLRSDWWKAILTNWFPVRYAERVGDR